MPTSDHPQRVTEVEDAAPAHCGEGEPQEKKKERAQLKPGQAHDPELWAALYQDYRTGQWSLAALAAKHGVSEAAIRAKAKREGWTKDLAPEIREEVRRGLGAAGLRDASRASDAQIIENATKIGLAVIRGHQSHLAKLKSASASIIDKLQAIVDGSYDEAYSLKTRSGETVVVPVLGKNETLADALLKVANATARFVPLERQAWNLNDRDEDEPYEERLRKFYEEAAKRRREFASDRGDQTKH